jgi:hypothetical protein
MTTTVKVEAHCASSVEVVVEIHDDSLPGGVDVPPERLVLQDGESIEPYVYDNRRIVVYERPKTEGIG